MISLSRQVEILLLEHDCVILPGFGAFIANHAVARMSDRGDALVLPPYRVVGFNQEVKSNDGLLAQAYMDAYDANYPDAYRQMEMDIEEMNDELDSKGEFSFNGVGTIYKDIDGKINFTPVEAGLLTPSLYGLYAVEIHNVEELVRQQQIRMAVENTVSSPVQTTVNAEKVDAAKNNNPSSQGKENGDIVIRLHPRWKDVAAAAVAAVFFFFIFSYPAMLTPGQMESVIAGSVSVKQAGMLNEDYAGQPQALQAEQAEESGKNIAKDAGGTKEFVLVMASKVSEKNALNMVKDLKDRGFGEARIIGNEKMRRVVYSCYSSEDEARDARRKLLGEYSLFTQSWVMELQ